MKKMKERTVGSKGSRLKNKSGWRGAGGRAQYHCASSKTTMYHGKKTNVKLADVETTMESAKNDGTSMKTIETAEKVDRPWKP